MNVIVVGTVISFPPGVEWYYNSCKDCMKKVSVLYFVNDGEDGLDLSDEKQTVRCINDVCNEKGVSVVPRLKLQLKLQDSTGIASLTCLDHVARKLLGKTAEELVDKFLDGETDKLLPDEISNLVGKKMAFKVEISHFNVNNHYKSFTVKRFSGDPEIISQLESKIGIDHVALSNSMNLSSGDFASVDTVDLKDDSPMSMIGSSAGSISLVTKNAEKISQLSELKRNLGESYDHEESATKVALGCNEELNTYNKDKRKTRKYSANQKDSIPFNNAFETPVSLIDSSAGGMALRNKRTVKMKEQPELKRVLAEDFDRDESGSKDPLSLNEGSKSLLIPKKEK
ncbi:putative nucleic acid-binding, replication factor A [Helianthus debilis subsp. tardiflorus]